MGTWIVHLRVADYFLERIRGLDVSEFVAGSVAPDCGWGKKDNGGEFIPPPSVTHWTPTGQKVDCRYKDFYNAYLQKSKNIKEFSFYLGYYVHLLTDIVWSAQVYIPTLTKYKKEYEENPKFILTIKKDWNDLDFLYLKTHPNFRALRILQAKKRVANYLPYYEPQQLTIQCREIANFYRHHSDDLPDDREFVYLTPQEQDGFIRDIIYVIEYDLASKGLLDASQRRKAV